MGVLKLPPANCAPYFAWSTTAISVRTLLQSTSSSSATICGNEVLMPCPISGFLQVMVTISSGAMRMYALMVPAASAACDAPVLAADAALGKLKSNSMPPPATVLAARKLRRDSAKPAARSAARSNWSPVSCGSFMSGRVMSDLPRVGGRQTRGLFNGGSNAGVGGAAADVAAHRGVDILVRGLRLLVQQGGGRHNLSRLAVATLHDIERQPRFLHLLTGRGIANGLDGGDLSSANRGKRCNAGADGRAVEVDGATPTQSQAAPELRPFHVQKVAQHPQQRGIPLRVDRPRGSIYLNRVRHRSPNSTRKRAIRQNIAL